MEVLQHLRRTPLSPGGSAAGAVLPRGTVVLEDRTAVPRFGIKGAGAGAWLQGQSIALPAVNRVAAQEGMRLFRLGSEDFLLLAEAGRLEALAAAWREAPSPRGYWAFREEGWAWMRLSGPAAESVMARLCAVDLRTGRFGADAVAQTRLGGIEAVVARAETGFDLFFDIASTAWFVRTVATTQASEGIRE